MGFFGSLFGGKTAEPGKPMRPGRRGATSLVRVRFRDLDSDMPSADAGWYTYAWDLPVPPQPGMRVWVPGIDGLATAVVVDMGHPSDLGGSEPKCVARLAKVEEIQHAQRATAARERRAADLEGVWLRMMMAQAGLKVGRVASVVPDGFPEIPPVSPDGYPPSSASDIGRVWWKAYRRGQEEGIDPEAVAQLKRIADEWFAVRDKAEQERYRQELRARHPGTLVRGRHFTEWADDVKDLKREGRLEDALSILNECMAATIAEDPGMPAPWYFEQAAIVLRKLKRPDHEVSCLRYYLRNAHEPDPKLVERLTKLEAKG